jgi:AraC-like DNA-binding protein
MSSELTYYREYAPHVLLSPYIDCYWVDRHEHGQPGTFRILPDACMDIIFNFTGDDDPLFLVGTSTTYIDKTVCGTSDYFGIRFRPGGLYAFTRQPMHEFTDNKVYLKDLSRSFYVLLVDAVRQEMSDSFRIKRIEEALLRFMSAQTLKPVHQFILASIGHIANSGGRISIPELADHACTGERQLQRTYMEMIGVSPKTLCNITRYIRARHYIKKWPDISIEEVAHENGYFDRSHLFREFKRFSGKAPG